MSDTSDEFRIGLGVQIDTKNITNQIQGMKPPKLKLDVDISHLKKGIQNAVNEAYKGVGGNTSVPKINSPKTGSGVSTSAQYQKEYQQLAKLANQMGSLKFRIAGLDASKNKSQLDTLTKQLNQVQTSYESLRKSFDGQLSAEQFSNIDSIITDTEHKIDTLRSKLSDGFKAKFDTNDYAAQIKQLEADFSRLGQSSEKITAVKTAYQKLQTAISTGGDIVGAGNNLTLAITSCDNELKIAKADASQFVSTLRHVRLSNKIRSWLKNNTAATKEAQEAMRQYLQQIDASSGRLSEADYQHISAKYDSLNAQMRASGRLGNSTFATLKAGISKFTSWIGASAIVMRALNEFKNGINTIKELDASLTNINYTMDVTSSQLKNIGNSSVQMAKDLKTSTSNVLQAVTLYANANETAESILEKSKTAIMLSNVSGLSGAEAADLLQGVINQFELGSTNEDLKRISDVIQNVSQNLAYDFSKGITAINDAISTSGSVAHMAGLSLEEYAAMVGKTIEISRQDGGTVGNAYKTIFSRITKASATEGTSEEDISKAEESLRAVNIEVRKSATEFRDVTDILADLGAVWDDLSSVEQSNISFNLAGTRQTNILKSLLSNWEGYASLVEKTSDAQGITLKNQEKYAESIEGRLKELKSTGESVWNNILNSGELKAAVSLLTTLVKLLDEITDFAEGLGTVGLGLGAFLGIKNAGRGKMFPLFKCTGNYKCSLGY